jgi:hypothetical protein
LRSASARQILPSVPGLSSIERMNSLAVDMWTSRIAPGVGWDYILG